MLLFHYMTQLQSGGLCIASLDELLDTGLKISALSHNLFEIFASGRYTGKHACDKSENFPFCVAGSYRRKVTNVFFQFQTVYTATELRPIRCTLKLASLTFEA